MSFDEYPKPAVTVDIIVLCWDGRLLSLPLIQRKSPPFEGAWALPGGFLEMDETLEEAARRELREETGLQMGTLAPCSVRDAVDRDPRGRVLSVPYVTMAPAAEVAPEYGDDAASGALFPLGGLPPTLAFDHSDIIVDACRIASQEIEQGNILPDLKTEERKMMLAAFPEALVKSGSR